MLEITRENGFESQKRKLAVALLALSSLLHSRGVRHDVREINDRGKCDPFYRLS